MKKLAAWYQKKISSYDKEEWETMVEQLLMRGTYRRRIVDFSTHARSYLIDVDLVRGSSFPKAKPTLGMPRVVWFALVRLLFLPVLYQWWAQQTSPACAKFLFTIWVMQVLNMTIYFVSPDTVDIDPNCWLVPLGLMLVLSVVHSQIVSTTEMELARVRPRATFRRKLPRYFRQPRSDCDGVSGGGSAESGATSSQSKAPSTKPSKLRRKQSRNDIVEHGLRKRKKELTKENVIKNIVPPVKHKTIIKVKDSDDEDYMAWKKPDVTTPIVTFTPPPDDAAPGAAFRYGPDAFTTKQLDSFNVRQNQQTNAARVLADGDDGFESLNGYNSNGSEGDKVKNDSQRPIQNERGSEDQAPATKPVAESSTFCAASNKDNIISSGFNSDLKKSTEDEKSFDPDSDSVIPTSSPNSGKRVGVRFRSSWAKDMPESTDDDFTTKKKEKKLENYQSSSSDGECSASAPSIALPSHHTMSDWVGHTTNSEESSYSSQSEGGQLRVEFPCAADSSWDPFALLDPTTDTVKCTMWERGSTLRAALSAVDISWCVVARAERALAADGCLWAALAMAAAVALIAPLIRLVQGDMHERGVVRAAVRAERTGVLPAGRGGARLQAALSVRQAVLAPHVGAARAQVRAAALQAQHRQEHQDLALHALLPTAARPAALRGRDRVHGVHAHLDAARVRERAAAQGLGHHRMPMAAGSDGVELLSRHLPAAAADTRQQRQQEVPRLPVRHTDGADQPAPGHRAAAREQGAAHRRQQRAQARGRPAQGAGRAVQDIGHVRQPLPVHHHQGGNPVGAVRGALRDAGLQVETSQD